MATFDLENFVTTRQQLVNEHGGEDNKIGMQGLHRYLFDRQMADAMKPQKPAEAPASAPAPAKEDKPAKKEGDK